MLLNEYCPEIEVVGKGANVEEARRLIDSQKPEAVFLKAREKEHVVITGPRFYSLNIKLMKRLGT